MNFVSPAGILRSAACWLILVLWVFRFAGAAAAQTVQPATAQGQANANLPVLLLSDIHFEPFWDPDKAAQLDTAPVAKWNAILASPPSPGRQQSFDNLQQSCNENGSDTSYPLFQSSLGAMRADAAGAAFVTVSGDLISHAFPCKYGALFPHASPGDYRAFVEKTVDYVIDELNAALPSVPVYIALGNNDSDCGDYRLDGHSEFLADTAREVTKDFPATERQGALESFAAGGYYSVSLPASVGNARLLVLDDIFMSSNYATCAGKADPTAADEQIAWLAKQLNRPRRQTEGLGDGPHSPRRRPHRQLPRE